MCTSNCQVYCALYRKHRSLLQHNIEQRKTLPYCYFVSNVNQGVTKQLHDLSFRLGRTMGIRQASRGIKTWECSLFIQFSPCTNSVPAWLVVRNMAGSSVLNKRVLQDGFGLSWNPSDIFLASVILLVTTEQWNMNCITFYAIFCWSRVK